MRKQKGGKMKNIDKIKHLLLVIMAVMEELQYQEYQEVDDELDDILEATKKLMSKLEKIK